MNDAQGTPVTPEVDAEWLADAPQEVQIQVALLRLHGYGVHRYTAGLPGFNYRVTVASPGAPLGYEWYASYSERDGWRKRSGDGRVIEDATFAEVLGGDK